MARPIAYRGLLRVVAFAVCSNGESPGEEFFDQLRDADKAKMLKLFQRMGDTGRISNREKYKKIDGQLWEFKAGQIRMPCFTAAKGVVVITHGFLKKSDSIPLPILTARYGSCVKT